MKEKINSKLIAAILILLVAVPVFGGVKIGLADDDDDDEREYEYRRPSKQPPAVPVNPPVLAPSAPSNSDSSPVSSDAAYSWDDLSRILDEQREIQDSAWQEKLDEELDVRNQLLRENQTLREKFIEELEKEKAAASAFTLKLLQKLKESEELRIKGNQKKIDSGATAGKNISPAVPVKSIKDTDKDGVSDAQDVHPGEDDFAYLVKDSNNNGIADDLEEIYRQEL